MKRILLAAVAATLVLSLEVAAQDAASLVGGRPKVSPGGYTPATFQGGVHAESDRLQCSPRSNHRNREGQARP